MLPNKDAHNVIIQGKQHQGDQEHQPDLLNLLQGTYVQWSAPDPFDTEKENMSPIENRNGEEIQYA